MKKLQEFNRKIRKSVERPELRSGDIVKIHRKIKEGNKERIQVFEGIVVSIKGKQSSSPMVTVRRVSFGVGIEITIPLHSPSISKIDIVKKAKVRKSKLYYLRKKNFRISKLKMKELDQFVAKEEKEESLPEGNEVVPAKEKNNENADKDSDEKKEK